MKIKAYNALKEVWEREGINDMDMPQKCQHLKTLLNRYDYPEWKLLVSRVINYMENGYYDVYFTFERR